MVYYSRDEKNMCKIINILRKFLILISLIYAGGLCAQVYFSDEAKFQRDDAFKDPSKKTSESSQAVYDQGGQNKQFRITESEKGLDYVKKEITILRNEIENLKREIQELKIKSNNISYPLEVPRQPTPTAAKVPTPF